MKSKAYYRRLHQLCDEINRHPYRDEIIALAKEQLIDDTDVVDFAYADTCRN